MELSERQSKKIISSLFKLRRLLYSIIIKI